MPLWHRLWHGRRPQMIGSVSPYANSGMTWQERLEAAAVLLRDANEQLLAAEAAARASDHHLG